jgi:hypothetical protein
VTGDANHRSSGCEQARDRRSIGTEHAGRIIHPQASLGVCEGSSDAHPPQRELQWPDMRLTTQRIRRFAARVTM